MAKYKVVINEEVLEDRTYEIEAADAKEAARIAANQYLVNGKLPKTSQVRVSERWYDVFAEEPITHDKLGHLKPAWQFNVTDVEGDGVENE